MSGQCTSDNISWHIVRSPLIAKKIVEIAELKALTLWLWYSPAGNDQVRFELTSRLESQIKEHWPCREWHIRSRETLWKRRAHHVPVSQSKRSNYSRDRNNWHNQPRGRYPGRPWQSQIRRCSSSQPRLKRL
jgi:argininosuccinate synthase